MAKTILVVDDEVSYRERFYDLLSAKGYKILTASGAEDGLEVMLRDNPDLVLLDINMPKIDGVQALIKIREKGIKSKVIMLTAPEDLNLEIQARSSGASGFLKKDAGDSFVVNAVEGIISDTTASLDKKEKKILIVDDNPRIAELLEKFLNKKGFSAITAGSGEEALEKVKRDKPILVLLDVKMPGMHGLLALKLIKEIDSSIGVIMITGINDEAIAKEAMSAGAYDYIVKPLDLDYLEMCLLTKIFLLGG